MSEVNVKLPYIVNCYVTATQSLIPELYRCNSNITELYKTNRIREKCVIRFNAYNEFLKHYFTPIGIQQYGSAFLKILYGDYNGEQISMLLNHFYENDIVFKRLLEKIYHCEFVICENNNSFFQHILLHVHSHYLSVMNHMRLSIKGAYDYIVRDITGLDLFIAVNLTSEQVITYDGRYYMEAINAENWNGSIRVRE